MKNKIQLFQNQKVRSIWNEEEMEWYFSIVDVVAVLTEQSTPRGASNYWAKLKERLIAEGSQLLTNCQQLKMQASDGKLYFTDAATTKQLLRIIQSIPSKKAEPFKLWLAEVGNQRINEAQDPELTIDRAMRQYQTLGYDEEWIKLRLQSIQVRKDLTTEWQKSGVESDLEYAILTNLMTKEWAGKTIAEYKKHKGLKKESLRDNMTTLELVLNMLAEATTSEIHQNKKVSGFDNSTKIALRGASVAKTARIAAEQQTGRPVISARNAKQLQRITYKKK